jgi:outer membrane protein assembly factor BamB
MKTSSLLFGTLGLCAWTALSSDWPCWRGPDGLGVTPDRGFPTEWSKEKSVVWSSELPGKGASSPIVIGKRVYITSQTPDTALHVIALDRATGKLIWDREIGKGKAKAHQLHNMATPTVVAQDDHVWALFGTGDLVSLEADGKLLWQRNLATEYGAYNANHGYGSSPMLWEGTLYIPFMHQGPSYVLAVDARAGKNVWKLDRDFPAREEAKDAYTSPLLLHHNGKTEVIIAGAEALTAYDPRTGNQRWIVKGLEVSHPYGRTIAGATAGEGMVVTVASGFQNRGYTVGIKAGGEGDVTQSHRAWTLNKFSPDCPTPVIQNGFVFTIRDDGMASCVDLKSGEARWQERLFTDNVKVSPVAAEGRVYFFSGQANCVVVKAEPKFEIVGKSNWNEETLSSPAFSDGQIFLRTSAGLSCIGKR